MKMTVFKKIPKKGNKSGHCWLENDWKVMGNWFYKKTDRKMIEKMMGNVYDVLFSIATSMWMSNMKKCVEIVMRKDKCHKVWETINRVKNMEK